MVHRYGSTVLNLDKELKHLEKLEDEGTRLMEKVHTTHEERQWGQMKNKIKNLKNSLEVMSQENKIYPNRYR